MCCVGLRKLTPLPHYIDTPSTLSMLSIDGLCTSIMQSPISLARAYSHMPVDPPFSQASRGPGQRAVDNSCHSDPRCEGNTTSDSEETVQLDRFDYKCGSLWAGPHVISLPLPITQHTYRNQGAHPHKKTHLP